MERFKQLQVLSLFVRGALFFAIFGLYCVEMAWMFSTANLATLGSLNHRLMDIIKLRSIGWKICMYSTPLVLVSFLAYFSLLNKSGLSWRYITKNTSNHFQIDLYVMLIVTGLLCPTFYLFFYERFNSYRRYNFVLLLVLNVFLYRTVRLFERRIRQSAKLLNKCEDLQLSE